MKFSSNPRFLHSSATCLAWLCLLLGLLGISGLASAQTYWLDSRYDETEEHYATAEEACLVGELQRRLHQLQVASPLPHRISTVHLGPENGIGERTCQGVIQRRQFNLWLLAEPVSGVLVYGPLGELPACPLADSADTDTGQCLVAKCDHNCPLDGGNPSNPISSASGNKRQVEADWEGGGPFPLSIVRTYNSQRTVERRARPLGTGWTHNYAQRLVPIIDGSGNITRIRAHRPNGAIQTFSKQGDQWASDADTPETLTATLNANGQLQSAAYRRRDDSLETYDPLGRLTHITRADGFEQTLTCSNASPWVQTVTDPQGRTLQFTYTNGQLTTVTLPDGGTIHYTHTGAKLSSATGPDNTTRSYHYGKTGHTAGSPHDAHLLTGITDEAGQRHASWTYDHQARATQSMHGPLGSPINHTTLHYQADGSTKITDALGQQRHYQFSVSHKTARLIHLDAPCDACSHTAASKTWDANGHPQSSTDFDGHLTTYTFDARGRQTQKTQAHGTPQQRTTQTDWLPEQNKATEQRSYSATNTLLKTSNWSWNARGQLLSHTQTDPHTNQSRTHSHTYCESADLEAGTCPHIGLRTSSTDPLGHSTHYSYYPADGAHWKKGDLKTTTNPLGHTSEYLQYDSAGRVLKIRHSDNTLTTYSYSPKGQVASVSQSNLDGSQTRTATGQIHKTTRPDGSWLQYHYDSAGRLTKISDPLGHSIHYTLDSAGNPTAEHIRDANNHLHWQQTRSYTLLGRLQDATDANGTTHYQHNGEGHTTQITDALGRINQYSFDALQREQQSIEDTGGIAATIGHSHNALDQKRHTTDPKGLQTRWQHNALADLLHEESPDRGTTSWQHDGAGRLIQQTDARGQITNYSRDALGRITAITYPGEPELETSFQYDSAPATAHGQVCWGFSLIP